MVPSRCSVPEHAVDVGAIPTRWLVAAQVRCAASDSAGVVHLGFWGDDDVAGETRRVAWDSAPVFTVARAPLGDGSLVAAGNSTGVVACWAVPDAFDDDDAGADDAPRVAFSCKAHAGGVDAAAARAAGAGRVVVVSGGDDHALSTICLTFDAANALAAACVEVVVLDDAAPVRGVGLSTDGRAVFSAAGDGRVTAWRLAPDAELFAEGREAWVRGTAARSRTLARIATVDVALGDVRGLDVRRDDQEDVVLVYGDDGVATAVFTRAALALAESGARTAARLSVC